MTPTIALKCRLDRAMKHDTGTLHWHLPSEIRQNLKDSNRDTERSNLQPHRNDTEDDAAKLLLSMSNIVSNEIKNNASVFDDEDDNCSRDDSSRHSHASNQENLLLTPRESTQSPLQLDEERFKWNRVRTVSIDSPLHTSLLTPKTTNEALDSSCGFSLGGPALISPNNTPIGRGRLIRRASLKLAQKAKREHLKLPKMPQMLPTNIDVKEYRKKALEASLAKGTKLKTIGRKKFSWKNYPGKFTVASHQY